MGMIWESESWHSSQGGMRVRARKNGRGRARDGSRGMGRGWIKPGGEGEKE